MGGLTMIFENIGTEKLQKPNYKHNAAWWSAKFRSAQLWKN